MTSRPIDAPIWRYVGSAASWVIFAFSFTVFCLSIFAVLQVGGTCASGGPYVIAIQCPDDTGFFSLTGVYGGLGAVFLALLVARGFGTRLVVLAWPILFLTLSLPFVLVGAGTFVEGGAVFLIIGLVFVVMALIPLVLEFRAAGPQRTLLGITDAAGHRFAERPGARASMMDRGIPNPPDAVPATVRDWALSLALWLPSTAVGAALGVLAWNGAAAA